MGIKMKYIKMFETYNQEPLNILKKYIPWFDLDKCIVVNSKITVIDGHIELNDKDLVQLPMQFKDIANGWFIIDNNKLITLKGCPETVSGYFSCSGNKTLKSLEYMPDATRIFYDDCGCSDDITQLKHLPLTAMKNGQVFNYYTKPSESYFIYDQKYIDEYWNSVIPDNPCVFESLKYNKNNKLQQKSNYISWELAQKYSYLKRSKKTDLWDLKKK